MATKSANLISFSRSGGAGNVLISLSEGLRTRGVEVNYSTKIESSLCAQPLRSPRDTVAATVDEYLFKDKSWPSLFSLTRNSIAHTKLIDVSSDFHLLRWPIGIVGLKENVFGDKPVIWGLPDMHAFTGGCHYSGACEGFKTGCSSCPAVRHFAEKKVEKELRNKLDFYSKIPNLLFLSPTQWMLERARESGLAEVAKLGFLPNPVPSIYFEKPQPRDFSVTRKLKIGFVAAKVNDPLKGYEKIRNQVSTLVEKKKIELHVVGEASNEFRKNNSFAKVLGRKNREEMVDFYDSIDVIVVPSLEENVGGVVPEAQSRGVPAIVSNTGGLPEQVEKGGGWVLTDVSKVGEFIESLDWSEIALQSELGLKRTSSLTPWSVAGEILHMAAGMAQS